MKYGIDRINEFTELFKNKSVGLITNPTGLNSDFETTIDILHKRNILKALFSPEHGVRGDLQAGVKVDDYIDPETNVKVYSLYGKNKKPSKEMLEGIDMLCFDIQDVGARYYTFLYTLTYALEAAKENNIEMVVFDRPNPVGDEVEGIILDPHYSSFIGKYPIPQRYGLTIGEFAHFVNKEYNINALLTVIKMEGYQRSMNFIDTDKHYVLPSPNLPSVDSLYCYLTTCLFEGTNMSEGRGTTKPFTFIGAPYLKPKLVLEELSKHKLEGVIFREINFTPTFSKHKNTVCHGIEVIITNYKTFMPVKTGYILHHIIKKNHKEFDYIPPFKEGHHRFFDLLTGSDILRKNKLSLEEQLHKMESDSKQFKEKKRRYELYE